MKFRLTPRWPLLPHHHLRHLRHLSRPRHLLDTTLSRELHATRSSFNTGNSGSGGDSGTFLLVPGATMATILMLGILHARRLYDDKKVEDMKEKGIELEFSPDVKASFLRLLPLRSMSRCWGFLMSVEIPVRLRPFIYKAWARAFHSNLDEAALPLENYVSLQEFFIRTLKEGSRPIDPDPNCLVSPVDGKILRLGELRGSGAMIEQVKGFSYSAASLLGANSLLHDAVDEETCKEHSEQSITEHSSRKSWWRISFASPKLRGPVSVSPKKGLFYCVIYLKPGDYHRVHSPIDWHVLIRRHFSGRLFPLNERATRTIRNLHVENERVVLEGRWEEGFIAMAAIGATNVGSIKLFIEPELKTNRPRKRLLHSEPPDERVYEPEGVGVMVKKGEELAAFNMGSTVVLVFQASVSESPGKDDHSSEFKFCVKSGDKIKVGEVIGKWSCS
ncbi:phosphatidylserine decarboxylase proenzyme 1, mitochondrial isoform X2 [Elaeis guineensis]|uniref:Phosphatidylserine decarboxylase proenzyme 1, mitochondrial n=1 Tax=Elaeis guineensis var. tenera TaxID=51953 RepID=A0A6I9R9B4_ELAGV|nr:phosphatidylserine decarboxylase proenzyme 1, mitochondrial isoform X2 [Elaeis guineensis]